MNAHVLLYLLKQIEEKRKICEAMLSILSPFCNELNIFNNTRS